jgi:predicted phosphate transport protein (TIGR00153 family)
MGLFDFLFRNQRHIETLLAGYLDAWKECLESFRAAMQLYLDAGASEEFGYAAQRTHKHEARADDLRRRIELEMYAKGLLPESRHDILGLLESIDGIPNRAEVILFILDVERVDVPEAWREDLRVLVERSLEATDVLLRMARHVFAPEPDLLEQVRAIDEKESECDVLKRALLRKIFRDGDVKGTRKLQVRDVAVMVGELTDMAESVADRIALMCVKRKV